MKKRYGICAITLVIAGLLISSVASIPAELPTEKISNFCTEIDTSPQYKEIEISREMTIERPSKMNAPLDSYIIIDTDVDEKHPTLAGDASGRFFAGFELYVESVDDTFPDFWYSLDDGMTWDEAGYFSESAGAEYPDVDSNENGFYGTFSGPINNPAEQWVILGEDIMAISGRVWDWSANGFDDFMHMSISSYTMDGEPWNYGGLSGTGYNGYSGNDVNGCPYIFYSVSDTSGIIGWLNSQPNYLHSDFAIDEITGMSYAVYDNIVDTNLLLRKDNFGVWASERHPYVGAWFLDEGTNLANASVEAHDNNVVVVAEEAGDIVCFYSNNGWSSQSKSTVASSAIAPEVKVTFDGEIFACSYVKGGAVYVKTSTDGGATWTDEQQVQDSQAVAEFGSHCLGKGKKGIYSVWEDTRGGDIDIFFGQAVEVTAPELDIISISGPIGVTAVIKNIGDAEATDVDWTLEVTGGILGQINKDKNGSQATLGISGEIEAKSGIIIGLGKIEVTVTATCAEGVSDEDTASGTQILIFSLL